MFLIQTDENSFIDAEKIEYIMTNGDIKVWIAGSKDAITVSRHYRSIFLNNLSALNKNIHYLSEVK